MREKKFRIPNKTPRFNNKTKFNSARRFKFKIRNKKIAIKCK